MSLSDPAFRTLREEKQAGESDSDVVLRLTREARAARRRPLAFLKFKPERDASPEEQEAFMDDMDAEDRRDMERPGRGPK